MITVMHTGTMSVRRAFESIGYVRQKPKWAFTDRYRTTGFLYQGHAFAERALEIHEIMPLITTIRDPRLVVGSFLARYGSVEKDHMSLRKQYEDWLPLTDHAIVIPIEAPEAAWERVRAIAGAPLPEIGHENKGRQTRSEALPRWDVFNHPIFERYSL